MVPRSKLILLLTYLLTYLLTPCCRVLLEKLTGLQLVKKFPAFHGTRRFITALTSVRHLSLSWASPIQSVYPHTTSSRSILILSTHLRLGLSRDLFPSGFPTKTLWVRREGCIGSWWGNRSERDHWEDLGVDGCIILGWISRRWDVGIWTGLGWLRIETGGGRL